ncbi:MAG: nucleotidyltransferase substrate binding protein [Armatimonadota bacterium]|nr:nucleotidyltransferase substrate binding protein [Armatimonadota bacterium]
MHSQDIRWVQRLNHFSRALAQLRRFVEKGELSDLEKQGLIKAFEYNYELAWNLLKDYLEAQGETGIHGSRDAFRTAFQRGIIEDGEVWLDMVRSRILTVHTYNEETAEQVVHDIIHRYFARFVQLQQKMEALKARQG